VARRNEATREFAYIAAVKDLARDQDACTARFAPKRLEIRTPLRIEGGLVVHRVGLALLGTLTVLKNYLHSKLELALGVGSG
jgi:hypothetical protein